MPIPFTSALYYPSIDITNEQWLRNAVLFWDSIRTIVPESMGTPYSNAFARDLYNEGVLEPVLVSPAIEEIDSLTEDVLDFLTDPASAEVILSTNGQLPQHIHPEKLSHELRDLIDIHVEKLPYIIERNLHDSMNGEWLHVSPGFAKFYMTLLATRIADRLGLGLITESGSADQLAISVQKGKYSHQELHPRMNRERFGRGYDVFNSRRSVPKEIAPGLLLDTMVRSITLPPDLSVQQVLKFKNDHREELSLFRRELNRLTEDLSDELSIEALRQAIHDKYEENVVPAMKSLRRSLVAQGWEAGLNTFLKVSFFSASSTSAAILAGIPGTVALLAGIGISITASSVLLVNQLHKLRETSPYSYLLSIDKHF